MQTEEFIVKLIVQEMEKVKENMYKGLSGSERAKKRARVGSIILEKIMKTYRKNTTIKD